jgi:hydroxymethylglutaryl-CoA lyase
VKQREFTIVECPRDAMQGISKFIPTAVKIEYIKSLLECNFDVLDCGSFVNPESVPQMADTPEVIAAISEIETNTKFLVIVANERGALRAVAYPKIKYLGYPFSLSETFQRRNTNSTQQDAYIRLAKIQEIAEDSLANEVEIVEIIAHK